MELQTWWLFVGMTFVVSATPGPNMLLVMQTSAARGWRLAMATMAGCMTSLLLMMSLSAAGVGALLHALPAVFTALCWLGAAYLAYLGVSCWRSPVDAPGSSDPPDQVVDPSAAAPAHTGRSQSELSRPMDGVKARGPLYRQGALVAASNPKAILFAAAFFPQFIRPDAPQLPQFGVLLVTFACIETGWYLVYALGGHSLSRHLRQPRVRRVFNRVTGAAFVGFAVLMAATRA